MDSPERSNKNRPHRLYRTFLVILACLPCSGLLGSSPMAAKSADSAAHIEQRVTPLNLPSEANRQGRTDPGQGRTDPQGNQQVDHAAHGTVSGTVIDQSGAIVAGAQVTLVPGNQQPSQQVVGEDGQFSFSDVVPGPFQLTVTATDFTSQTISDVLQPGENFVVPQVTLHVAPTSTSVRVEPPRAEVAETQIKAEEKQRLFAVVPNFYVSYIPNAAPLTSGQKFELAWRTLIDPFTFALNGAVAGIEQADNAFQGYGQGAAGYGRRFGASYADLASSTLIGSALLPSILKQDPRYFYKGRGTKRSRLLYALANSVICKGDNGHWEPNYSYIAGSLAAGGLSNLYYPKSDRNRVGFIFESTAIGVGETAIYNVFQEFFLRKVTPKHNQQNP
jgi:hypothetical protein